MISKKIETAAILAGCLLALAGCGDDSTPPDSGPADTGTVADTGTADTGTADAGDAGPTDSGTDSGTPATDALVRVANLVPNGPAFRVCADVKVGGTVVSTVGPLPPRGDGTDPGIPFRGVSGYLTFPVGVDYTVNFYDITAIDALDPEHCPVAADGLAPLITADVPTTALEVGKFYTVAATGFLRDSAGDMPALCSATLDTTCPDALEAALQLLPDTGAPASGKVSVRVVQGIPNMPNLDVCYDAVVTSDAGTPEPAGSPTLIVGNVGPTAASAYVDMDPMTDGFITIHAYNAAGDCLAAAELATVPIPFPDPIGTAFVPGSTKTFDADTIVTIFGSGRNIDSPPVPDPSSVVFIPMFYEVAP